MNTIPFLAIGLSTLFAIVLGMIWYSDTLLVGKIWMKEMGFTPPTPVQKQAMMKKMMMSMAGYFLGIIVTMYVYFHMLATYKTMTYSMGLQGAFFTWLGFYAMPGLTAICFEGRSWKLYAVNQGFNAILLVASALIYVAVL